MLEKIEEMLFENIGRKIKAVACVGMLILSVGSLIAGLSLIIQEDSYPAIGLLIIIFGPPLSWVAALTTYGFGRLIENSDILIEQGKNEKGKYASAQSGTPQRKTPLEKIGRIFDDNTAAPSKTEEENMRVRKLLEQREKDD